MTPAPALARTLLAATLPRALRGGGPVVGVAGARRARRRAVGLGIAVAVAAWARLAAAGEPAPVVIEGGSCPSAAEVRAELEPLLDDPVRASIAAAPAERLRVVDYGDRYRIEVGTTVREVADPERDCAERARISAVFIAMNLALPPAPLPAPVTRAPAPVVVEEERGGLTSAQPVERAARSRVEVGLMVELVASPEARAVEPGGRLGLSWRRPSWIYSASTGVIAPARLELEARTAGGGHVELLRVPTQLGVTWARQGRRVEVGPLLAVAGDVLVLRGRGLDANDRATRFDPGAALGAVLRARAGAHAWAFSTLTAAGYPARYRLRVEPAGTAGRVPHWWFGLGLGLAWTPGTSSAPRGGVLSASAGGERGR